MSISELIGVLLLATLPLSGARELFFLKRSAQKPAPASVESGRARLASHYASEPSFFWTRCTSWQQDNIEASFVYLYSNAVLHNLIRFCILCCTVPCTAQSHSVPDWGKWPRRYMYIYTRDRAQNFSDVYIKYLILLLSILYFQKKTRERWRAAYARTLRRRGSNRRKASSFCNSSLYSSIQPLVRIDTK